MEMKYFYEVFENVPRQGPGSEKTTSKTFNIIENLLPDDPKIIDLGCGTGAQTIQLAKLTDGTIIALDNHPEFIEILNRKISKLRFSNKIYPEIGDMGKLRYPNDNFDLIWSEGSIYNLGFENGLRYLKRFLRPDGFIAVSEAVYLSNNTPEDLKLYWNNNYPEITTVCSKIDVIEKTGYQLIEHFTIPKDDWFSFYDNIQMVITGVREKNVGIKEAKEVYELLQDEIDLYNKYSSKFGYEFFILKK